MKPLTASPRGRFDKVSVHKAAGITYTPPDLGGFIADAMLRTYRHSPGGKAVRILDPALGEGQLLASLLARIPSRWSLEVHGFDTDEKALGVAQARLHGLHPKASLRLLREDFLQLVNHDHQTLLPFIPHAGHIGPFDLIIANPPYVRTQVLGAAEARNLAFRFGLRGRVDLYYAFLLTIARLLAPRGIAGVIVSNRFMTTRAGASVRAALRQRFQLTHVWDFGDTKLFNAAVLPAVVLAGCPDGTRPRRAHFTSIYETTGVPSSRAMSVVEAITRQGVVEIDDGRRFHVRHGLLDAPRDPGEVWRIGMTSGDTWLKTVESRSRGTFRSLGRIRVGVKTCADQVFILTDPTALAERDRPELLRPLTTHHIARRFRADASVGQRYIIYPHESVGENGRPVALESFPRTQAYLERHRATLEARKYVIKAGRRWYEIWVPQNPGAWSKPKLVFRDISAEPCFWLDYEGSIVNGDCYWLTCDKGVDEALLWLAAGVGNSTFISAFYDCRFNNKLYAGRRRFISQYVEHFPLPDPMNRHAQAIIRAARELHSVIGEAPTSGLEEELNRHVWAAFGLDPKEVKW